MIARTALGLLALLMACSPAAPPDPTPPAPVPDLPESFRELHEAASKIDNPSASPLLIVVEAAHVARALRRGQASSVAQADGHQSVSWMDLDYGYSWTLECWPGYPSFPGSSGFDPCESTPSPSVPMDEDELVMATWRLIDAMGRRNGYNAIHADLQRDMLWDEMEQLNFKIWFTDPSGTMWYWQWTKLAGFGETDEGGL